MRRAWLTLVHVAAAAAAAVRVRHVAGPSTPPRPLPMSHVRLSRVTMAQELPTVRLMATNLTMTQGVLKRLPDLPAKVLSAALIAGSMAAGSFIVPEALGITAVTVGAGSFGGVGGTLARKVRAVAKALDVPPEVFAENKADLYGAFLQDLVAEAEVRVQEVAELQSLRRALGLVWPAVGSQHIESARFLARGRPAASLQGDELQWRRVRKLVFLSDCVLSAQPAANATAAQQTPETSEAVTSGTGVGASEAGVAGLAHARASRWVQALERIEKRTTNRSLLGRAVRRRLNVMRKAGAAPPAPDPPPRPVRVTDLLAELELTAEEGRALSRAAALPFYERALQTAIAKLSQETGARLEKARDALRLDLSDTAEAHAEAFGSVVERLLVRGRLEDDDMEILNMISDMLYMRSNEATPIVESKTRPLYAEAVADALDKARKDPKTRALALWGPVSMRLQELRLSRTAADEVLNEQMSNIARPLYDALSEACASGDAVDAQNAATYLAQFGRDMAAFVSAFQSAKVPSASSLASLFSACLGGARAEAEACARAYDAVAAKLEEGAAAKGPSATADLAAVRDLLGRGMPEELQGPGLPPEAQQALQTLRTALETAASTNAHADFEAARTAEEAAVRAQVPPSLRAKARLDPFYDRVAASSETSGLSLNALEALAKLGKDLRLTKAQLQELEEETGACTVLVERVRSTLNKEDAESARRLKFIRTTLLGL